MADDIVTRLRHAAVGLPQDDMNQTAADEIERLRAERDDHAKSVGTIMQVATDEIERLRAAGDALATAAGDIYDGRVWIADLIAAWEEARRG